MIDALKRIEEALDPYAPWMLIAMFLWLIGGCFYEALSWAANRPAWKTKSGGPWAFCRHISGAIVERLRRDFRGAPTSGGSGRGERRAGGDCSRRESGLDDGGGVPPEVRRRCPDRVPRGDGEIGN